MISPRRDGKVNELKVFLQVLNTISNLSSNEIIWRVRFYPRKFNEELRKGTGNSTSLKFLKFFSSPAKKPAKRKGKKRKV